MAAPANDNVVNAQALLPGTTQVTGDTTEATAESGEYRPTSNGTTGSSSAVFTVWFTWVAPSATPASISTTGSTFDSYLTIWQPASGYSYPVPFVGALEPVASNDDGGGGGTSLVNFTPVPGRIYYVQVSGFSGVSDKGPYTLNYPSPGTAVATQLFTSQTPAGTNNSDGSPGITTATTVQFAQAGYVTAARFYATTTVSGTYTGALWQVTGNDDPGPGAGTLLASKVRPTAPAAGVWNLITFDTPVAVTTGVLYRVGVHSSAGRYVNTTSFAAFVSGGLTNGDITAPADGDDPAGLGTLRQGVFEVNASLTYPDTTFSDSCYFVDVDFVAGSAPPPAALAPRPFVVSQAVNRSYTY